MISGIQLFARISSISYYLLAVVVFWPRYFYFNIAGVGLSPFSISMLALEIVALLSLITIQPNRSLYIPLILIYTIYVFWTFLSDIFGEYPVLSFGISIRNLIYTGAGFYIGLAVLSRRDIIAKLPWLFTIAVLVLSLIGIVERVFERPFIDLIGMSNFMANAESTPRLTEGSFRNGAFRASSLFSHPIVFAQFVAASIGFSIHIFRQNETMKRIIGASAIIVTPIAIYVSNTRSGYIVFLVASFIYVVLNIKGKSNNVASMVVSMFVVAGIAAAFMAVLKDEIQAIVIGRDATEMMSSVSRDDMISTGLSVILQSPISGFGEGLSGLKAGLVGESGTITIDNLYLTVLLDFGYSGLLLFIIFLVVGIVRGVSRTFSETSPPIQAANAGMSTFCISIVCGQYIISIQDNMLFSYIFFGMFCASTAVQSRQSKVSRVEASQRKSLKFQQAVSSKLGMKDDWR